MKKKVLLCIAAFVFVVFAVVLLCHRLYMPRNVAYVALVMLQDKFHSVGVALRRG